MNTRKQQRVPKEKGERLTADGAQLELEDNDPAHGVNNLTKEPLTGGSLSSVNSYEAFFDAAAEPEHQSAINALFYHVWSRGGQPKSYPWEDLRQDTLLRFWKWLPQYRGEAKPMTVLYGMASNQMVTEFRRRRAQLRDESKEDDLVEVERVNPPSTESHEQASDNGIMIQRCREALTGRSLEIFEGVLKGEDLAEIAKEQGISRQATAMRWSRIKKMLRYVLENGGAPSTAAPVKVSLPGGAAGPRTTRPDSG